MLKKKTNIQQLLARASQKIDRFEAELLLAHVLATSREYVVTHPEQAVPLIEKFSFLLSVQKRKKGVPLAYLTGHKEFFGYNFAVNFHTLVPRPDTEILVEQVLNFIHTLDGAQNQPSTFLIDIGTGSGCIPISIAKELQKKSRIPDALIRNEAPTIEFFASDTSSRALRIAKKNAQKHNANIQFVKGNLLEPFLEEKMLAHLVHHNIIITANLPYLDEAWYSEESSIQHEPKKALLAADAGTALYKKLFDQLNRTALQAQVFIEIDPRQTDTLRSFIAKNYPQSSIEITKDLSGHDRVMSIYFPGNLDSERG